MGVRILKTNRPYTESFLKGLKTLTGVSYRKLESYAKENNPLNILEHPKTLGINEKQLNKIGLLKEIISSYNLLKNHEREDKIKFTTPNEVANYFVPLLSSIKDKERFMAAFLDNGNNIIEAQIVSEGTVSQTVVYPREVLKKALACDCSSIILAHNHPGGTLKPSKEDIALTQRLVDIFKPLDIRILDHIIVAGIEFTSLQEKSLMPQGCKEKANYEPINIGENSSKENIESYMPQEINKEEEWEMEI